MFRNIILSFILLLGFNISAIAQKPPLNVGIINKKATYLPKPIFPQNCRCRGKINVSVLIDAPSGKVVDAKTFSGHPLLRISAVEAARQARFSPLIYTGKPMIVKGILVYNFNSNGTVKF
jgi:outer membrane biosynthesis protein TonB